MPPKRKTATRASKRNKKEDEQPDVDSEEGTPEVEEPPKKQARGRGRKKKVDEEPEPLEESVTKESINSEQIVESKRKTTQPKQSKPSPQVETKHLPKSSIPASPSKRVSSISSRIPSPVKKHTSSVLTSNNKPDLEFKKTEQSINQNFLSKNLPKLNNIIDELKSSKAETLFDELKSSTETRFKTSDDLINSLTSRNQQLSSELEELKGRLSELENNPAPNGVANEEESFQNELILDMMEQIVGLRIHNVEDTDEALSFDCSQSGKNGVLDYKLTIPKEDSSEIIYTPFNKEDSNDLKAYLPEYFFDDLTFPIDTLQQFYHKIFRGLNK